MSRRRPTPPAARSPRPGRGRAALALAAGALALGVAAAPASVGAQVSTTTTTRPASSTTAAPTTAAPTTARPTTTVAPTTAAPTTTAATTTSGTAAGTSTTLAPPPPASNAPFPASFVAPVPVALGPAQLQVADVYETLSEDPTSPDVAVAFRAPFTLPPGTYRVVVVVGDPVGARLRTSLVSINGKVSGTVELEDATGRRDLGGTDARFDPSGLVVLRVPLSKAPSGDAAWVEVYDNPGTTPDVVSPVYSRTALFGQAEVGLLPSSLFGRVVGADQRATTEVVRVPAGPVVSVVNQSLTVDFREPVPGELAGQPVTQEVDTVPIAPSFDGGAVDTPVVRINRTDGTITLLAGSGTDAPDRSGDRSWIAKGLPENPGGSGQVVLDLRRIAELLGITPSSDRTAFGSGRTIALADKRTVVAGPVLATLGWFESAAPPPATVAPGAAGAGAGTTASADDRLPLYLAVGAAVVVLLVLLLVLVVRRRRASDVDWIARAAAEEEAVRRSAETVELPVVDVAAAPPPAGTPDVAAEGAGGEASAAGAVDSSAAAGAPPIDESPWGPLESPAPGAGAVGAEVGGRGPGGLAGPQGDGPQEEAPGSPTAGEAPGAEPVEPAAGSASEPRPATPGPLSPTDLLASLDDDLADYRQRLRRLDGEDEPGSSGSS